MALFWAPGTRWVDELEDVGPAASSMWMLHTRAWGNNRTLMRFLREHYFSAWERVRECRVPWEWYAGSGTQRKFRVEREACGVRPFCPACNNQWQNERAHKALKVLTRGTPAGQPCIARLLTLAPRGQLQRKNDWHKIAREHHREYMRGVWRGISETFGEGVGAFAIYQDYGTKPFLVPHPHVHVLVNGWRLEDDAPKRLPYFDAGDDVREGERKSGNARMREAIARGIEREVRHGVKLDDISLLSLRVEKDVDEPADLKRLFRYNYRELIDPTLWKYPAGSRVVRIDNYHDPHDLAELTPEQLKAGVAEYGARLGKWGEPGSRVTDARFGILADSQIKDTQRLMGADAQHKDDCICPKCMTWGAPHLGPADARPIRVDGDD